MPKESRHYKQQTYRTAWESMPEFEGWLKAVPDNPTRAYCTVCSKTLMAHRISLLQHTSTAKHIKQAQMQFLSVENEKDEGLPVVVLEVDATKLNLSSFETTNLDSSEGVAPSIQFIDHIDSVVQQEVEQNIPSILEKIFDPAPISTHVLDNSRGLPVINLQVTLYKLIDGRWTFISENLTNPDGRCSEFILSEEFKPGRYKLHYDVDKYFELRKQDSLYPFIEIVFDARSPSQHIHIPLILSPFGYSTYLGS